MTAALPPIRVLIIDDAPLFRRQLAEALDRAGDLHALGCPGDLVQVRAKLVQFHPDVILLDLGLRRLGALELLDKLRVHYPVPVLVFAGLGAEEPLRALRAVAHGAVEVVQRPESGRPAAVSVCAQDLAARIRGAAAHARPVPLGVRTAAAAGTWRAAGLDPAARLIVLGASTGGTRAIEDLLGRAPPDLPGTAIVQHMPAGFTQSFAQRLNSLCSVTVSEARDGDVLTPGRVLIARGDTHLVVRAAGGTWRVHYTHQLPVNRHCPSVDVLFDSAAAAAGRAAIGVLLTGMGDDGARGLANLRASGALTIGQSKHTCVVYGMPKVAADLGAVQHTGAPDEIPGLLLRVLQHPERAGAGAAGR